MVGLPVSFEVGNILVEGSALPDILWTSHRDALLLLQLVKEAPASSFDLVLVATAGKRGSKADSHWVASRGEQTSKPESPPTSSARNHSVGDR